ncbi:DUF2141 domain-containing protein [Sphingobium sp. Cam5-1]|uniref:DUF2141 domain-containing protein n=1 Tax=Sphingobium sp. Cam5-1 TaxID=2789327 RepID=UPI0018AD26D6|nr:DUF2141 domain-containing protein [Sphingobium sp. Cam5-1]QPI72669.1 DUF2141 domain-containing protein [Sphingobium sp. Cam5-1]
MLIPAMLAAVAIHSSPELGKAAGQCRPGENGSAFLVDVEGLKDRKGLLKLELYPSNDKDFLADDNVLIAAGKAFARVETGIPPSGPVSMCIRAPGPGTYALSLMQDRNSNHRFSLSADGVGFPGNPRLGLSKPPAAAASTHVGDHPARLPIRMNYWKGLFSFGPLER